MILRSIILVCCMAIAAVAADATPAQTESQKFAQAARVLIASVAEKCDPLIGRKMSGGAPLSEDEEKELTQQCLKLERLRKFLGRWSAGIADTIAINTHDWGGKPYTEYSREITDESVQDIGVCTTLIAEAGRLHARIEPHIADRQLLEQMDEKVDRVVTGDVFRVPNGIYRNSLAGILYDNRSAFYAVDVNNPVWYHDRATALHKETASVRVWATTPDYTDTLIIDLSDAEKNDTEGSCNWADHGHPRLYKFPPYLPLSLFIDADGKLKKEGDTVTLQHYNPLTNEQIKIVLTLSQGKYRYRWCGDGKFDRCIKNSDNYTSNVAPFLSDAGRAELSGT